MDNRLKYIFVFLVLTTGCICIVSTEITSYIRCFKELFDYAEYDSRNITYMINSPYYDKSLCTLLFIHGFDAKDTGPAISNLTTSALLRGGLNVCLWNWINVSRADNLLGFEASYLETVPKTKTIGSQLGKALEEVADEINFNCFHIYGHSMGAHVAGWAGKYLKDNGAQPLPWIYALDAAGPFFGTSILDLGRAVRSGDATFTVAVITNPNDKGTNASRCDVNVRPNGNRTNSADPKERNQPGCKDSNCSHDYSWKLINATLAGHKIPISHADTYWEWAILNGTATPKTQLGEEIDISSSGEHFCRTTGEFPYTLGEDSLRP